MSVLSQDLSMIDRQLVVAVNRINLHPHWARLFALFSRLGDGVFWYALMAALPILHGWDAWVVSAALAANGVVCTIVYKILKLSTRRPRPCDADLAVFTTVAPLDRFSFPSGHTLHAVGFTLLTILILPIWAALLIPVALIIALSRLVLGLHWPSDVFAGAIIGASSAVMTWQVGAWSGTW